MSVNPKWNIVGSERDESADQSVSDNQESQLTPDLLAIADRLSAEAADLATRFPAKQMVAVRSISGRWKIAAAAVLVGITASSAVFGWWLHGSVTVAKTEPGRAVAEVARNDVPHGASDLRPSPESFTNSAGVQEVGYAARGASKFQTQRIRHAADSAECIRAGNSSAARRTCASGEIGSGYGKDHRIAQPRN